MIDVSRRTFLVGTAAALAAANIGVAIPQISIAHPRKNFPYRAIHEIAVYPNWEASDTSSVRFEILRQDGKVNSTLLHMTMGRGSFYFWRVFNDYDALIYLEDHVFGVEVTPELSDVELTVMSSIDKPDEGPKEFIEGRWQDIYEEWDDEDFEPAPKIIGREWIKPHWRRRRRSICESYRWQRKRLVLNNVAALDVRDSEIAT